MDDDDGEDSGELETDDPDDYDPRDHSGSNRNNEYMDLQPPIQNIQSGGSVPFVSLIWNSDNMKYGSLAHTISMLTVSRDLMYPEERSAKFHIPPTVHSEADCFYLLIKRTWANRGSPFLTLVSQLL